ncbi:MAG: RtcB family protein [Spirochaetota bacterium]|nr:RtcB family protein [Spirochaetota bacterium]
MSQVTPIPIDKYRYKIPKSGKARVDGLIFADANLMSTIQNDDSLKQVINVAHLPGIVKYSIAMPDIHLGYGFPIGGIAAFDMENGVVSPGGVGYDINCGVRLLKSNLHKDDIHPNMKDLVDLLFMNIPTGVGSHRKDLKLSEQEMRKMVLNGANWAVKNGFGNKEDIDHIEEHGKIPFADDSLISERAFLRGRDQLGTLGSGNHFVEVGYVSEIYDEKAAQTLGLNLNYITVLIHTGSRGFGYQICEDFLRVMDNAAKKYHIELPDRQLCCAPINSKEGKDYLGAMGSASNFAFNNRQIITHWVRETFETFFNLSPKDHGLKLIYDVAHNIAKIEEHMVDGKLKKLCVHRKGATRAFPPNHKDIPLEYKDIGQPILVPGDMGRCSYVLVGTEKGFSETFGSCCHGAGRLLSRNQAKKASKGRKIDDELAKNSIFVRSKARSTLFEEMPDAYKNVSDVVNVIDNAGIGRKIAKLRPLGVIKG